MYVSILRQFESISCQNQADVFYMADARSGEEGSSFGDQFPQMASIFSN